MATFADVMHWIGLRCLRLSFASWPTIPMFRKSLWDFLKNILTALRGLRIDRIVVVGASKGSGMAQKNPWSPVHFVGGDDVGSDNLISHMRSVVSVPDDLKVIRWVRENGKLHLEVVSTSFLLQTVDRSWTGPTRRRTHIDAWPTSGSCTLSDYDNRHLEITEPMAKAFNPSAAE